MRLAVLFVDDCDQLRSIIGEYITAFGIECYAVGTLTEAQCILAHGLVDVMVTDLLLERRPAYPLIETARTKGMPTIVASALPKERTQSSLGELAELVHIIEKPFDLSHLRRLITLGPRGGRCRCRGPLTPVESSA